MLRIKDSSSISTNERRNIRFDVTTLRDYHGLLNVVNSNEDFLMKSIRKHYNIPHKTDIVLTLNFSQVVQNPDFGWERRVKVMYRSMLELEKLMWNLSTLGGAYSAMGDFYPEFAETAAKITQHQIVLASRFGDPALLARCFLYTALAEAQLGRFSSSVKIVRTVYSWSKLNNCELVNRCSQGVYQKIVAIHQFGIATNGRV